MSLWSRASLSVSSPSNPPPSVTGRTVIIERAMNLGRSALMSSNFGALSRSILNSTRSVPSEKASAAFLASSEVVRPASEVQTLVLTLDTPGDLTGCAALRARPMIN